MIQLSQPRSVYGLAFLAGMLLTLAFAPIFLLIAAVMAISLLLWLLDKVVSAKQAFWVGWWFGFGHHLLGLYWIANSLLVDAASFAWLIPFSILLIPAAMALYIGVVSWLLWYVQARGLPRLLILASLWVLLEIARAHLFTGFPWNLLGYAWMFNLPIIQSASIWGVYGLSLLFILISGLPYLVKARQTRFVVAVIVFLTLVFLPYGFGAMRLQQAETASLDAPLVRIVQGNIEQKPMRDFEERLDNIMRHQQLSIAGELEPDLVIWPESGINLIVSEYKEVRDLLADALTKKGSVLLSGSIRYERGEDGAAQYWNTMFMFNREGETLSYYDKHHLVPFGEFVPLRSLFPFLEKITEGAVDFSRGEGVETVALHGYDLPPFSPLICYEGIFPGKVVAEGTEPEFIVNITNDAWFGDSLGPFQHLHMVRLRAIEEGLPLFRAANTGISAAIDSYGRILNRIPLNEPGSIDVRLPEPVRYERIPFYAKHGLLVPLALIGFCLSLAACIIRWHKNH